MKVKFFVDPETGQPHILDHGVTESEARHVVSYLACRFTRFLVLLHKPSQHAMKAVYSFIPRQDFSEPWTDLKLYKRYGITNEEIAFIEAKVKPLE